MKAFDDNGIAFECFEALPDVGGIWNPESPHAVYGSTHLNSSEKLTRYIDLWFPEGLPYYLSCSQAEDYLRSYARKFGLYDLGPPPEFQKFVCGKVLYNYDNLEPSERRIVL